VDDDPAAKRLKPDAPYPLKKGGLLLFLYNNSLAIAFMLLFAISFVGHRTVRFPRIQRQLA
jgi:uncharacterized protein DUF6766